MAQGSRYFKFISWSVDWSRDTSGLGHMARSAYMLLAGAVRNVDTERGTMIARPTTLAMHMRMTPEEAADAITELAQTQRVDGAALVTVSLKNGEKWVELEPWDLCQALSDQTSLLKVVVLWVKEAEEEKWKEGVKAVERVQKYNRNISKKTTRNKSKLRSNDSRYNKLQKTKSNNAELPLEEKRREENSIPPITPQGGSLMKFKAFWDAYPKKIAKVAAERAWKRAVSAGTEPDAIQRGLLKAVVSEQWTRDGGKYIPHATTWLNQQRWEDELQDKLWKDVEGNKNAAAYDPIPEGMMYE